MSISSTNKSGFPFDSILSDVTYILLTLLLLNNFTEVVKANYLFNAIIAYPFTLLAFFAMGIISVSKDEAEHTGWYKKYGSKLWRNTLGLFIFGGFAWMMPIRVVIVEGIIVTIDKDVAENIDIAAILLWWVATLILYSISGKLSKNKKIQSNTFIRYSSSLVISLFMFFFTSIFISSMELLETALEPVWQYILIGTTAFLFLPIRMSLLLRPPFNPKELISFFVVYGVFIVKLVLD